MDATEVRNDTNEEVDLENVEVIDNDEWDSLGEDSGDH